MNVKRVLITGGAGFIAHHMIGQILETTDWEVVTLDRLDYSGNLNRLHDIMLTYDEEIRRRFPYLNTLSEIKEMSFPEQEWLIVTKFIHCA